MKNKIILTVLTLVALAILCANVIQIESEKPDYSAMHTIELLNQYEKKVLWFQQLHKSYPNDEKTISLLAQKDLSSQSVLMNDWYKTKMFEQDWGIIDFSDRAKAEFINKLKQLFPDFENIHNDPFSYYKKGGETEIYDYILKRILETKQYIKSTQKDFQSLKENSKGKKNDL